MALHGKSPSDDVLDIDALFATEPEADVPSAPAPVAARVSVPPSGRTAQEFADEPLDFADEPALRADPAPVRVAPIRAAPVASLAQQPLVVPQRRCAATRARSRRSIRERCSSGVRPSSRSRRLRPDLRRPRKRTPRGAGSDAGAATPGQQVRQLCPRRHRLTRVHSRLQTSRRRQSTRPRRRSHCDTPPVQPAEPVAPPAAKPAATERPAPGLRLLRRSRQPPRGRRQRSRTGEALCRPGGCAATRRRRRGRSDHG